MSPNFKAKMRIGVEIDDAGVAEEHWLSIHGTHRLTPERKLMFAVLDDAIDQLVKDKKADAVAECRRWIAANECGYPFSFNNIWNELFPDHDVEGARSLILKNPSVIGARIKARKAETAGRGLRSAKNKRVDTTW